MKSRYQIEATRLMRFADLLQARAMLIRRQELFEHKRKNEFMYSAPRESWEKWLLDAYDAVWNAQQRCCEFEYLYPKE